MFFWYVKLTIYIFEFVLAGKTRNHFTGIMIGTTCGIIFIVLSALAIFHTQKLRRQRAQSRRSEVASTASFDVHQASAPPSYEAGKTGINRSLINNGHSLSVITEIPTVNTCLLVGSKWGRGL